MVDVSRQSTFPPLLGSYKSQISTKVEHINEIKSLKARHLILAASEQTSELHKREKTICVPKSIGIQSSPKLPKDAPSSSPLDKRQRETKKKKPEMTLKAWDGLIKKERDKKHCFLQQRVKIQRDLIGKTNQHLEDLRTKVEQERLENIQSLKHAQREVSSNLSARCRREHHKKVSKKVQETEIVEESEPDSNTPVIDVPRNKNVLPLNSLSSGDFSPRSSQNAHAAVLRFENSKTIDTMWGGMKANALRKISPVIKYSNQLKQVASPSVKQCLEIYDKPALRDRYTGKPIPLSDVLEEAKVTRGHQLSAVNKSLQSWARNTQRKAQIMLDNKDTFISATSCDPKFYLVDTHSPPHGPDNSQSKSKSAEVTKSERMIVPKRCNTSLDFKRQLPSYLTSDGNLVSGSLEELGDQVYCAPSRTSGVKHTENSVFQTDPHGDSSSNPSISDLSNAGSQPLLKSLWQPLCSSALAEHRKVTELSVSGLGHLAHGKYSMWKPASCIVNSEDSLETLDP